MSDENLEFLEQNQLNCHFLSFQSLFWVRKNSMTSVCIPLLQISWKYQVKWTVGSMVLYKHQIIIYNYSLDVSGGGRHQFKLTLRGYVLILADLCHRKLKLHVTHILLASVFYILWLFCLKFIFSWFWMKAWTFSNIFHWNFHFSELLFGSITCFHISLLSC